jgi:predicted lipoprotein with Yx(FWY)xxD motif
MMAHRPTRVVLVGLAVAALVALAACGSSSKSSSASPSTSAPAAAPPTSGPAASNATVSLADSAKLGSILVDAQGRTLYLFGKDTGTQSTCTGQCATFWPPLTITSGQPTAGNGANASLVSTTMRSGGVTQVTYNGHPVYMYGGDKNAGDTNGEGINAFGGSWYAVSPAGAKVAPRSQPQGGYGGGY